MSIRSDSEKLAWLLQRQYNLTASKIAPIVKEYSEDPYWSNIECYSDSFSVYCESLLVADALFQRSKEGETSYNRFGNFAEPFIFSEFLKFLDLEELDKEENIIYNVHHSLEDTKIACTPDYIIKIPEQNHAKVESILSKVENLNSTYSLFNKHANFDPSKGTSFLLECKTKGANQLLKECGRDEEGNIVPSDTIILQLQTQMLVMNIEWGVIATLISTNQGLKFHYYFMNACPKIREVILTSVERYFKAVEEGNLPLPQTERNANFELLDFNSGLESSFYSLNLKEKKEKTINLADLPEKKRKELLDLVAFYKDTEKEVLEASARILDLKRDTFLEGKEKSLKEAKTKLDRYFQALLKTKGEYTVYLEERDLVFSIIATKDQDWVCRKPKTTVVGDILKKGERHLAIIQANKADF